MAKHAFLPRSGSRDASTGEYLACGVNGCAMSPKDHPITDTNADDTARAPLGAKSETFTYGNVAFTLESLSESDKHLRWIIDNHKALPGMDFCEICSTRTPCDTVSLAASGLFRSAQLAASQATIARLEGELVAERERNAPLRARIKEIQDKADQQHREFEARFRRNLEAGIELWRQSNRRFQKQAETAESERDEARRHLDVILGYPTPVYPNGFCWFCVGGLGHYDGGHKADCVWVAAKLAQPDAEGAEHE